MGDLDTLVDMGFDREKAQMGLKKGGNLTGAIDWLEKNADKTIEQLKEEAAEDGEDEEGAPKLEVGEQARSMVCNECGKKFRGMNAAQFHAEKSGHVDFGESTEELAPLTEAEKAAKLAEMRARLAEKRAGQAAEEKLAQKRNDEIKKKHTKASDDAKEELQRKEQIKEAQKKKQEKADDIAAKKRIKEKIEADKAARKRKADEEKAMRQNPDAFNPGAPAAGGAAPGGLAAATAPKTANHSEARLRLQTPNGNVMKTLPAETTLFEVSEAITQENGTEVSSFTSNFPRKTFTREDFGMTLKEAGLVPSAALTVQ
ncbi:hypothetical protein M409DRAFT_66432 [Zasmidium cellare ATCC 36951]|uniref:UBX domain-containing protein n=1 Tax=Zasmidium cellare ATCC 36951 TaxID=1080233 RepID=A0A6A6CLS3_ZASCE|nr:uncharacterized protein M409DRAFT_66432 [Zasmidium cellare ATCC 36951]KAF2166892.1 hypothetical protein M409DRAFT_66432 [Zasmidium cellare ATCC 36951]